MSENRWNDDRAPKLKKVWMGEVPRECDLCGAAIINVFVDGRLSQGSWACMCVACHAKYGTGLGTGKGQQYESQPIRAVRNGETRCECGAEEGEPCNGSAFSGVVHRVEWVKVQG